MEETTRQGMQRDAEVIRERTDADNKREIDKRSKTTRRDDDE